MTVKSKHLLQLIHILKNKLSVDSLLDAGLTYSQILNLLDTAISQGMVSEKDDGELTLTDEGYELEKTLMKKFYHGYEANFILPLDKFRVEQIDKFDVYLPRNKD